jgi:hypothetical protein
MKVVQELLNEKIAQRFPTAILLLDFYMQMIVVIIYTLAVQESANIRFGGISTVQNLTFCVPLLFIGATYFLVREIIQVFSLISLKALHIWVFEPGNWLNGESFLYDYATVQPTNQPLKRNLCPSRFMMVSDLLRLDLRLGGIYDPWRRTHRK